MAMAGRTSRPPAGRSLISRNAASAAGIEGRNRSSLLSDGFTGELNKTVEAFKISALGRDLLSSRACCQRQEPLSGSPSGASNINV